MCHQIKDLTSNGVERQRLHPQAESWEVPDFRVAVRVPPGRAWNEPTMCPKIKDLTSNGIQRQGLHSQAGDDSVTQSLNGSISGKV